MLFFIKQRSIKLIKSDSKDLHCYTLKFLFSKEYSKKRFHKNNKQHNLFIIVTINIDNKCFLSILEWFLKDHVTLKTGVMASKNSALWSQEKINIKKY